MKTTYVNKYIDINEDDTFSIKEQKIDISISKPSDNKLGVMVVGLCGNNGSTFTAGLLADKKGLTWENKNGNHKVDFLGSIYQYGSVHIGYKANRPYTKLIRDMVPMRTPKDIVIGGWDICNDNLYISCQNNKVIDYDLLRQLKDDLEKFKPLESVYYDGFIATNQKPRVDNIKKNINKWQDVEAVIRDIQNFKETNKLQDVIVVWSGSTERMTKEYTCFKELLIEIENNSSHISPSIIFAVAASLSNCIFVNTSPQNTISHAILEFARVNKTFAVGSDLKSGQTKLKSVLADFLASSGIKPLSIVSYNHLGNRDGMNLDETAQFKSKEQTKRNVIDDVIDENPELFQNKKPDHSVIIKYVPAVGDSKRAIDEYFSELFLDGRNILSIYNLCEDSLLAVPIILDIVLFSDFFSRVSFTLENGNVSTFKPDLSLLSFFFKAPTDDGINPVVNTFFRQLYGIRNFVKICNGLPVDDFINLHKKI